MKKVISLTLIIAVLLCTCLLTACKKTDVNADVADTETPTADEYFFFNLLSDGTYEISAKGIYDGETKRIVIPSKHDGKLVSAVSGHGFKDQQNIEEVVFPASIKTISLSAFYGCTSLQTVTIPASVTDIKYLAFYGCTHLTEVHYGGTKKQWKELAQSGGFGSDPTVYCSDGTIAAK